MFWNHVEMKSQNARKYVYVTYYMCNSIYIIELEVISDITHMYTPWLFEFDP